MVAFRHVYTHKDREGPHSCMQTKIRQRKPAHCGIIEMNEESFAGWARVQRKTKASSSLIQIIIYLSGLLSVNVWTVQSMSLSSITSASRQWMSDREKIKTLNLMVCVCVFLFEEETDLHPWLLHFPFLFQSYIKTLISKSCFFDSGFRLISTLTDCFPSSGREIHSSETSVHSYCSLNCLYAITSARWQLSSSASEPRRCLQGV